MLWVISTSTLRSWSPGASAIIKAVWIWMNSLRKRTSPGIRFSTCTTWWSPTSRVWAACWCYLTDKKVDWGLIENFRLVCLILDSWDVHTHHHEDSREGAMPIISWRSLTVNAEGAIFATVLGRGKLHDHTTRSAEFYPAHESVSSSIQTVNLISPSLFYSQPLFWHAMSIETRLIPLLHHFFPTKHFFLDLLFFIFLI